MTKEQQFFIQVLADHLNGEKTEPVHDLDWDEILCETKKHQLSGIFYTQAKSFISPDLCIAFRQETHAAYLLYMSWEAELDEIGHAFGESNIPFFVVKGPTVGALYPIPWLRVMGDVDLIVQRKDRETCHEILTKEGFFPKTKQRDREWQYYKNGLETELHDRLVYKEAVNEKGQDVFFNKCWNYLKDGKLDWSFHLLFLIFHLRKHLMNSGAGFRQFLDLAVVAKKADIDWDWLVAKLKETDMMEFAEKCYGFINRWFGINTPIAVPVDNDFFEMATQKIFADGIFGDDNKENEDSAAINQIRNKRFPKLGIIRMILSRVFPPCKELENIRPYTYLQKCSALLPVAWIHRFIRGVNQKKDRVLVDDIRKCLVPKEKIDKRSEILQKWGL